MKPRTRRAAAAKPRARKAPLRGPKRPKPAGQQKKKRRLKVPKIPLKPEGPPPSYFELLQDAVQTLKDMSQGASLSQIRRQLQRKYKGNFDEESNDLTTALQRLAERGKVIRKEGPKYRFNEPHDVSESAGTSAASSFTGTSRSGASSGFVPSDNLDSHTSASSSFSESNRSKESPHDAPEDADESPGDADAEGKSSTGDLSSSAPSASSTASRASSKRR